MLSNGMRYASEYIMKTIHGEYRKKCGKQPLGTKEPAECIRKLAESIILQCIEDLWDKTLMKQSTEFFSRRGFSICAAIAGMDIRDQVKLLDLINCAMFEVRCMPRKASTTHSYVTLAGGSTAMSITAGRPSAHSC